MDASVHKGMPFKFYHGRTGVVFNITKRAVGVTVNKLVSGLIFIAHYLLSNSPLARYLQIYRSMEELLKRTSTLALRI